MPDHSFYLLELRHKMRNFKPVFFRHYKKILEVLLCFNVVRITTERAFIRYITQPCLMITSGT